MVAPQPGNMAFTVGSLASAHDKRHDRRGDGGAPAGEHGVHGGVIGFLDGLDGFEDAGAEHGGDGQEEGGNMAFTVGSLASLTALMASRMPAPNTAGMARRKAQRTAASRV